MSSFHAKLLQEALLNKLVNRAELILTSKEHLIIEAVKNENYVSIADNYELADDLIAQIRENIEVQNYRRALQMLIGLFEVLKKW